MDPKTRLAQLESRAGELVAKAEAGTLTETEASEVNVLLKERKTLQGKVRSQQDAADALNGLKVGSQDNRGGKVGAAASKASRFAGTLLKALEDAAPVIGGPSVQKALVPAGAVTAPFLDGGTIIEDPTAAQHLLSAIGSQPVDTPSGSYLRQTKRESNAAPVKNGDLKPQSVYELEPVTWNVATIAHVSQPLQTQWLADYAALEQFLATEMAYGVDAAVSAFVLNGGIDENGNPVTGILTTDGVQQTAFRASKLLSIRRALGQLESEGVAATGIVMSSDSWEDIETALDADGRFLLPQAPTQQPVRTLYGVPVTLVQGMPDELAIVGDLSTVHLLFRNSLQLAWNDFHADLGTAAVPAPTDLFRRNQTVMRAEIRVALELSSLKTLRVVDLTV